MTRIFFVKQEHLRSPLFSASAGTNAVAAMVSGVFRFF